MEEFMKIASRSLLLVPCVALLLSACDDTAAPDENNPPALPPAATMQADFSVFESGGVAGSPDVAGAAGPWFLSAAIAVGLAKTATFLTLALPSATFAAATSHSPVFSDGAFHWTYSASQGINNFSANLSATPQGSEAIWEMRVTSNTHVPSLTEFLWFSGRATLDATSGEWHIFNAATPAESNEILSIDWSHTSATDRSLIITNVNTQSADNGDVLVFDVNGDIHTVRFTDFSVGTEVHIQWNSVTSEGFIEAPNVNGGVRACWASDLENTVCPG